MCMNVEAGHFIRKLISVLTIEFFFYERIAELKTRRFFGAWTGAPLREHRWKADLR